MSSQIQEYISYIKSSVKEIVKAIILVLLIVSGPFLSALLRLGGLDTQSIFIIGSIVEIIAFVVIFFFGKKGYIFKIPRETDLEKSPKAGKEPEE